MKKITSIISILLLLLLSACQETIEDKSITDDENSSTPINNQPTADTTAPVFDTKNTDLQLNEGSNFIAKFSATDSSSITYSVQNTAYEITQDGSLSFFYSPSYSQTNSNAYQVTITATDSALNSTDLLINIEILDIAEEDNSNPVFSFSDTVYGAKQGVTAIESFDATDNSLVTYSLENSPYFSISQSAVLSFIDAPFYSSTAAQNLYDVTIIATDTSNNTARLSFAVQILEPTDIYSSVANNSHNNGADCISCHGDSLAVAGTIYGNDVKYSTIRLIEESNFNESIIKAVQGSGNFATRALLKSATYKVEVLNKDGIVVNESKDFSHSASRANCNSCHTNSGTGGAPGRIVNYR